MISISAESISELKKQYEAIFPPEERSIQSNAMYKDIKISFENEKDIMRILSQIIAEYNKEGRHLLDPHSNIGFIVRGIRIIILQSGS